jgi:hypothetical protein
MCQVPGGTLLVEEARFARLCENRPHRVVEVSLVCWTARKGNDPQGHVGHPAAIERGADVGSSGCLADRDDHQRPVAASWTFGGRRGPKPSPAWLTEGLDQQGLREALYRTRTDDPLLTSGNGGHGRARAATFFL